MRCVNCTVPKFKAKIRISSWQLCCIGLEYWCSGSVPSVQSLMPVLSKYSALHLVLVHSEAVVVLYIGLSIVISFGSCLCLLLQADGWHWTVTLDL